MNVTHLKLVDETEDHSTKHPGNFLNSHGISAHVDREDRYCLGCYDSSNVFQLKPISGYFVYKTRFSRTSGKSFLIPRCRSDTLYVTDPFEHLDQGEDGDVGSFRGVFKVFGKLKVRKMLIEKHAEYASS